MIGWRMGWRKPYIGIALMGALLVAAYSLYIVGAVLVAVLLAANNRLLKTGEWAAGWIDAHS